MKTIKLSFGKSTPHLRFVDFVCEVQTVIDRDNMLNEDIDAHSMLLILLVDCESFFI
jgi:hypothetical protein